MLLAVLVVILTLLRLCGGWQRSHGALTVKVNGNTFEYQVLMHGNSWLQRGRVSLQCEGNFYSSSSVALRLSGGSITKTWGTDANLGKWQGIQRSWQPIANSTNLTNATSPCNGTTITTAVRFYTEIGSFEFVTTTSDRDTLGTATCNGDPFKSKCVTTATAFPDWQLPTNVGFISYHHDTHQYFQQYSKPPADWDSWDADITGGPLLLYTKPSKTDERFSLVLGPSSRFKEGMLAKESSGHNGVGSSRVLAGVQGHIQSIPKKFELRFALTSCDVGADERRCGPTSAMFRYGQLLTKAHKTLKTKLPLSKDVLSRKVHYLTDGGSMNNYCDYFPQCLATENCTRWSDRLKELAQYHRNIALGVDGKARERNANWVGLYHVDPYWYSTEYYGAGCGFADAHGPWTESPYHWPDGLNATGVDFQLFMQGFDKVAQSYYGQHKNGGPFHFEGLSIASKDATRFFKQILGEMHNRTTPSFFKSLIYNNFYSIWMSSPDRYQQIGVQDEHDQALADTLLELNLPMRADLSLPGDVLNSVRKGAHTVNRVNQDANPIWFYELDRYILLAAGSLLLRPMLLRPMVDVLWTNPHQSDPRWVHDAAGFGGICRPNVIHDIITAVLSSGPVGFGDLAGKTDMGVMVRAMREDGVILKPASAALRLDRFYYDMPRSGSGPEIWTAVSRPSDGDSVGGRRAKRDDGTGGEETDYPIASVANSMPDLLNDTGRQVWWRSILATNVEDNGANFGSRPVDLSDLWPKIPAEETDEFAVVQLFQNSKNGPLKPPCQHRASADSCVFFWKKGSPLPVATGSTLTMTGCVSHNYTLLSAAPVFRSGYALLGDLTKFVPVSPQRFVMREENLISYMNTKLDLVEDKLRNETIDRNSPELEFEVIGAEGERVPVFLLMPPTAKREEVLEGTQFGRNRRIIVVDVTVPSSRRATVRCKKETDEGNDGGRCTVINNMSQRGEKEEIFV